MLRILDSCSLLNLLAAWPDLVGLNAIRGRWCISEAVADETHFCISETQYGAIVRLPIDIRTLFSDGAILSAATEAEHELYVEFATEVDDGEAMSLAIAKSRGAILVTDDRKALRLACRPSIGIETETTPSIIRAWAEATGGGEAEIRDVVIRVTRLARFIPPRKSADFTWWVAASDDRSG